MDACNDIVDVEATVHLSATPEVVGGLETRYNLPPSVRRPSLDECPAAFDAAPFMWGLYVYYPDGETWVCARHQTWQSVHPLFRAPCICEEVSQEDDPPACPNRVKIDGREDLSQSNAAAMGDYTIDESVQPTNIHGWRPIYSNAQHNIFLKYSRAFKVWYVTTWKGVYDEQHAQIEFIVRFWKQGGHGEHLPALCPSDTDMSDQLFSGEVATLTVHGPGGLFWLLLGVGIVILYLCLANASAG